ncbi:acyl carrier protein [Paludisphaera rhizosphaerae]|uniref:acyl carrier protein n=1 Tax=Paludisphaera rhizosphaerae TaxID=2711216 RepID=UPI0013E9D22F|nr:acyl carrier protein [Paludisphaera rhizosphaerae]
MATALDEITATLLRVGKLESIGLEEDIYEAGFPSIQALELLLELESACGVSIPDDQFMKARTARALLGLVVGLQQEQAA